MHGGPLMTTAAERKRKERALKRAGIIEVLVQIPRETRDVMVETGHLPEWDEDRKEAVQAAAQRLLDSLAAGTVTP